jgi:hypothetical protein
VTNRYALIVGINAYPPGNTLSGCVNDAYDMQKVLSEKDYQVTRLIDGQATLGNIVRELKDLVSRARYGDRIVFTYSGHGTWAKDASGDEPDRRDEAICPVDCFDNGMLFDDEIGSILGERKFGVRALQFSDSCFSGSVSRFAGVGATVPGAKAKFLPAELIAPRTRTVQKRLFTRPHLLMSGCTDQEYSYDAWYGTPARANGAFTRTAIDVLNRHNPRTYQDWHHLIRQILPNDDYPQSPVLEGSASRARWGVLT